MTRQKFDLSLVPPAPDLSFEAPLWAAGLLAAGIDEAGRGAWAGPVAAGAVILPPDASLMRTLNGVRDSKEMSPASREEWAGAICRHALAWGVGMASNEEIDRLGILPATRLAATRALAALEPPPAHLLLDFITLPGNPLPQTPLIKGDARSLSIACASVLAKTRRDAWMVEAETAFPGYGFARHKGYGVSAHRQALQRLGPCPLHRRSFAPLAAPGLFDAQNLSSS
ncbi:MAG TPA: ribonuclease HII [Anaerolineaceae bacterium]|nr:ribonuclease HII [Anaerolineaceae bacterium]HPN51746.1 ribonuclease HII [Anaerolineaceae bacterium]